MTYPAVHRRCEGCPHNSEALLGEAQAQYLESVIEDEDEQLEHLRICATCHRHQEWLREGCVSDEACEGNGDEAGLSPCRFSPSRWVPYWSEANRSCREACLSRSS